jgi:hypothetical protein
MNKPRSIELKVAHNIEDLVAEMFDVNDDLLLDTIMDYYDDYEFLDKMKPKDIIKYLKENGEL